MMLKINKEQGKKLENVLNYWKSRRKKLKNSGCQQLMKAPCSRHFEEDGYCQPWELKGQHNH